MRFCLSPAMSPACLLPVSCLPPACLQSVSCLFPACLLPVSCLSPACLLSVFCLSPVRLLPVSCLSPACLLPVYCLSSACLLSVSCLSPACLLPVHCFFTCPATVYIEYELSAACLMNFCFPNQTFEQRMSEPEKTYYRITLSLQPDGVKFWYFKLRLFQGRLFNLTEIIFWNI